MADKCHSDVPYPNWGREIRDDKTGTVFESPHAEADYTFFAKKKPIVTQISPNQLFDIRKMLSASGLKDRETRIAPKTSKRTDLIHITFGD